MKKLGNRNASTYNSQAVTLLQRVQLRKRQNFQFEEKMSLLSLPDEILEQILTQDGFQANDITAVSSSCRRFNGIIRRSARIWRRLFSVHFPEIAHQLEDKVDKAPHEFWLTQFTAR